jgi:bifunctional non-homologous end joining protein LigD
MANLAAIEIHVVLAQADQFEKPDLILFDIDPEPPATFNDTVETALQLKKQLDNLNLKSYIKTSGKKGLHILIPITPQYTFAQTRNFVHQIGKQLAKQNPKIVSEFAKTKEKGTIFIDYLQNSHGRTMICPYSLRATPDATASTPLEWNQLNKQLKPEDLNITTVPKIKQEPWNDLFKHKQNLEVKNE